MIDILSQHGIPVIPVNMVGVMGAGLASQAKYRLPGLEEQYRQELRFGTLQLNRPVFLPGDPQWPSNVQGVVLFATKDHFSMPSSLKWIEGGMEHLDRLFAKHKTLQKNHLWVPALGCGLGGLPERPVYDLFMKHLAHHPLTHYVGTDGVEWTLGHAFFATSRRGED